MKLYVATSKKTAVLNNLIYPEDGRSRSLRSDVTLCTKLQGVICQKASYFRSSIVTFGGCRFLVKKGNNNQTLRTHMTTMRISNLIDWKGKAIPVTGRGGPYCFEALRFPHFLDNRLTDGGYIVSLTRRPPFIPQEDSWYTFLLEAESTPGS
jgi:hypothetical protein